MTHVTKNKTQHLLPIGVLLWSVLLSPRVQASDASAAWTSPCPARLRLTVDAKGRKRSNAPATVTIDFQGALRSLGLAGELDPSSIEVVPARSPTGLPASPAANSEKIARVPHRLDRLFGCTKSTLTLVVPDESCTEVFVYFDILKPDRRDPPRYSGLVGDGDFFREELGQREVAASHFDQLVDLDGDSDLDLFRGGVEPYVYCLENVGGNRMVHRGKLSSGGDIFRLPASQAGRSWVTVTFHDVDADGDQDFFPSFNDGPDAGHFVFYRNVTRTPSGELTFERVGILKTESGIELAGGEQAGGWFPSLALVRDWDGDGDSSVDALVGSKNRCWLYRGLGLGADGSPRFTDAVLVKAGEHEIDLVNPRFECADMDGDADWDLLAATQPGPIYYFRNVASRDDGTRGGPKLASGIVVAFDGKYLIGDAHSGVKVVDLDRDGKLDLVAGRFWERTDMNSPDAPRAFGGFWANTGTLAEPRFERRPGGGLCTEDFQICDAVRQNCVRAVDWDGDGQRDLLAGDTDGFVWFFKGNGDRGFPSFANGQKLLAAGRPLSVASSGGHARVDSCDWNGDGVRDLVVADGGGSVSLFLGIREKLGTGSAPGLDAGRRLEAEGALVQVGGRASVLACDWNNDGRLYLLLADDKGYYFLKNVSESATAPVLAAPKPVLFAGKPVKYVRPNLGSFVDWDGDGKRDLIGCHFENSVRFYRNVSSGAPGAEPEFADPEGVTILTGSAPQMISGADVLDWNGDGDLDILTGQGHGGSGLRFFERDWIEDELHDTHPTIARQLVERKRPDLLSVVRRYADTMLEHGRDVLGPVKSRLFLSALDRNTLAPLEVRPAAPGGIRRGDRPGRAWSAMNGANPHLDENLLRVLYTLGEITGDERYPKVADEELSWFFANALSSATSLLPWGEHLSWDVILDVPICGGDEMMHEFARPWVLWDRSFALAPEASRKFAMGLWEHQIADHRTGAFDRHAPYLEHGPVDGKDFPRHAGFYIGTWGSAWKHTKDETFLRAIEAVLGRFERKRNQKDGSQAATIGPLDCETAAELVPETLAKRLRAFAVREDELLLPELRKQVDARAGSAHSPPNVPPPPLWSTGYSASTLASTAMFCLARYEQTQNSAYRDLLVNIAGLYLGSRPEEDLDAWPMSVAHAISTLLAAHRFTSRSIYLDEALALSDWAVDVFWQDSSLPRASLKTGHYETITGADSLALALLEAHATLHALPQRIPSNTIDR